MDKPVTMPVDTLTLARPYRSTRQILDVTSAMSNELQVDGRDQAFEGPPVDLVWATNTGEQAAAVARDVMLLLQDGTRLPQDIGVLATRKWAMGGVARALDEAGVPCQIVYPNHADTLDLTEPKVKILTVHSAKGLEFDVVFLLGLEQLPDPDGTAEVDRQGRTGYVGVTRARDQLVLSYSKDNAYLERVRALPETTLRRWVWPDDYPEA
jgi:superfamily I DNA/RNA helicase